MRLSLVIPAKSKDDPKLAELLASIERQDFPRDEMEVLVITDGTSESAKAIGIRRAKGEVIGILASDNELVDKSFLSDAVNTLGWCGAAWPHYYHYSENDDVLNRYFSLIGGNDPLSFYMRKNDRASHIDEGGLNVGGTIGDNGFFIRKSLIENTDLDNYYHIDNANEALKASAIVTMNNTIWHKTGGNIIEFFKKRYRYGLQHAFNKNRRWHLVDFRQPKDIARLLWFVVASFTIIHPLSLSIRGYLKIQDKAWFLHPVICVLTCITYSILVLHLAVRRLTQLSSAHLVAQRA